MSRKGNCLDNACMENFFSHLKTECIYMYPFETAEEMKQAVIQYIEFYNNERIQTKLNSCSPREYLATAV
jgi:transposase InsO family protein